jgi:hypothetical protein
MVFVGGLLLCPESRAEGPSARIDFRELGNKTPLTEIISQQWMGSDESLKQMVEARLSQQIGGQAFSNELAERFGFKCPQDVLSCAYRGSLTARFSGVPAENVARSAEKVDIEVKVAQAQPLAVRVHTVRTPFNGTQ